MANKRITWETLDTASLDFGIQIGASDYFFNEESCTATYEFNGALPSYDEIYAKVETFREEFESEYGFKVGMIERWQFEPRKNINLLTGEVTVYEVEPFISVRWPFRNLAAERAG